MNGLFKKLNESKVFKDLSPQEFSWVLYDVGNSAFTMLGCSLIPIWFKSLAIGTEAGKISSDNATAYWALATSIVTVIVALIGPVCGAIADHKIRLHDKVIEYYKPDILCMHDDYGNGANLFMDPETWRRVLKPHLKRVVDAVQSKGVIYEHHNCGYFAPLMDDMIEIGIGATNPVHSSNDIVWLKENYGDKMTFLGGFDAQMYCRPDVTEEEIRADMEHVFEVMAPGTSFIPLCIAFYSKHLPFIGREIARLAAKYHSPRP